MGSISGFFLRKRLFMQKCTKTYGNVASVPLTEQVLVPVEQYVAIIVHCVSYRNQSFVLQSKTNDWFLNERQSWTEMG